MMTKQKMKAAANLVSRSHLVAFGFSIFLLLPPLVFAAEDRSEGNNLELQGAAASEPAVGTDGGAPTAQVSQPPASDDPGYDLKKFGKGAKEALQRAKDFLAAGDLEQAEYQINRAALMGEVFKYYAKKSTLEGFDGDVADLKTELVAAKAQLGRDHIRATWKLVKQDKPDEARKELLIALDLGVKDEKLESAIDATPTARRRVKEEEHRLLVERREAQQRARAEQRRLVAERREKEEHANWEDLSVGLSKVGVSVVYLEEGRGMGACACAYAVSTLERKVAADRKAKAKLSAALARAKACRVKNKSLYFEGTTLSARCDSLLGVLLKYRGAPTGSDGARQFFRAQSAVRGCVSAINAYEDRVHSQEEMIKGVFHEVEAN